MMMRLPAFSSGRLQFDANTTPFPSVRPCAEDLRHRLQMLGTSPSMGEEGLARSLAGGLWVSWRPRLGESNRHPDLNRRLLFDDVHVHHGFLDLPVSIGGAEDDPVAADVAGSDV